MVQTRAQAAAAAAAAATNKARNPENQDQDAPASKRRRRKAPPKTLQDPPPQGKGKGRDRAIEDAADAGPGPSSQHAQISKSPVTDESSSGNSAPDADGADPNNPIDYWIREGHWPSRLFEMEKRLFVQPYGTTPVSQRNPSMTLVSQCNRSNAGFSGTTADPRPLVDRTTPYWDPRYTAILQTKGAYLTPSNLGVSDKSEELCRYLLLVSQPHPEGTVFDDCVFKKCCQNIKNKSEARIIQDITRLIVPSAETLALRGSNEHLAMLIESVNQAWSNSLPLLGPRPQPDYSVGFREDAFTAAQLAKLLQHVGERFRGDRCLLMATCEMFFPFLTCEVKCGTGGLDTADRQNAHSMTLAARGVVELFRLAEREHEVHREILAFCVSHDDSSVRIYGIYPEIDGANTKYYHHPIRRFYFTEPNGKDRWVAYHFTRSVYDKWMPEHHKRICSVIEKLPLISSDDSALAESTGLSQALDNLRPTAPNFVLPGVAGGDQSNKAGQMALPAAPCSNAEPSKKRKAMSRA